MSEGVKGKPWSVEEEMSLSLLWRIPLRTLLRISIKLEMQF
jgi:hypothetical protein